LSRTENSLRNIRYALAGQFFGIALSFVARIVFVRVLSAEYLGLNGLFSNILTMLSIAELGIGSAITYSMYEPLAQKDAPRLRALMGVYRKAYLTIGLVVGGVGALLTPALPFLVNEMPAIPNIEVIYLLFVANSAITYFFSYKRAFLIADQKRYIATIYRYGFFFVLNLVQMLVLVLTGNYILFLVSQVIFTLLENIAVSRKVDQLYPYLLETPVPPLSPGDRKTLGRNIKAMVFHRLGGVVLVGTDSIVMAMFVSVVAVGLYSNYLLITSALSVVLGVVFSALTASVGNLGVDADTERQVNTFKVLDLAVFWAYSFASISLFVLFNPFIEVWLGREYLFDLPVVLAIAVNFYLTGIRNSIWVFKDAKGLFWPDRYRPLVEIVIKLVFSVVLAQQFGVLGVLMGTAISTMIVCLPWEPYVLFRLGFKMSTLIYFQRYFLHSLLTIVGGAATWAASYWIGADGWTNLITRLVLCLVIPNGINWLVLGRSPEFRRLLAVAKRPRP
jgi:O-antigen/teichoic acid export membrane protein